ncbi:MAG TPA: DUF4115 domain-containing protein [Vicinamibacterales bacterium]|nr:DUF4115 domain-containing protein [Vicinamibacterales bacterium]
MPVNHRSLFPREDEGRVLEELERLHREIQKARRERDRAGAEFDEFVRTFREPPPVASEHAAPPPLFSRSEPRAPVVARGFAGGTGPPAMVMPSPPTPRIASDAAVNPPAVAYASASPQGAGAVRRTSLILGVLAVAVLAAGVAATWFWRGAATPGESTERVQQVAPPQPETRSTPTPAVAPGGRVDARREATPLGGDLTAERAVWVRVTQDGRRTVERELRAGERVALRASASIVIRAGDAGAVLVRLGDGRAEKLGRDGEVLTRAFRAATPR